MSADETWIDKWLSESKKTHPLVTEVAVERIRGLLIGQLRERQLSAGKLVEISKALLRDMSALTHTEEEASHED